MQENESLLLFDAARARRLMEEAGLVAVVASRRENVGYLTGRFFHNWRWGGFMHMLEREDDGCEARYCAGILQEPLENPFVVTEEGRAYNFKGGWVEDVIPCCWRDAERTPTRALAGALRERGLARARIGVEARFLAASIMKALKEELPDAVFLDATDFFWQLRMVKTEEELRRMRHAYRVAEEVYETVRESLKAGITNRELYELEMQKVVENDCLFVFQHLSFGRAEALSGDDAGYTLDYGVRPGDVGFFDIGLAYEDYLTDFGRAVALGEPDRRIRQAHEIMQQIRRRLEDELRPGVKASQVCEALDSWMEGKGMRPRGAYGHGLGIECHEPPVLQAHDETVLEEGMVIVPELTTSVGSATMLLEDGGVITSEAWRSLTTFDTEMIVVPG